MTEEGKRCDSKIKWSAKGQVRLPSSVTLPPQFALYKTTSIPNRLYKHYHHHRQCATFSSGEGFHSIRRFPHGKTFSLHWNTCRYCPDRGKPCHYDHLSTFTRSITNRSVSDPSCHFLHSALKNPKFKKAPENRRLLNEFKILTPPLMKLSKRKNISKGGIGCSVTLLLLGADLLFLAS